MEHDQVKRDITAPSSNTSSSISNFVDKKESIHMKALEQLTEKIDQILSKIQSLKNIRATAIGSDANLNKPSDYSISSKMGEVDSKGSIFNNLDSIGNEIGNAHSEIEDILDELRKSKVVLKREHFTAKKSVQQMELNNCKRKRVRKMVKPLQKNYVDIQRHSINTKTLKYRKMNKTTRKCINRMPILLSKMPLLIKLFCKPKLLKPNEWKNNFEQVSVVDYRMKTEESTNMTVFDDYNEIIVLYKRPIEDNLFCKDNEHNGATKVCDHDKESSSSHNQKVVCLERKIGMESKTVSDPMIGNYEGRAPTTLQHKNFYQYKIMSTHKLNNVEKQPKFSRASNTSIDMKRYLDEEINNFVNHKKGINLLCTIGTQTNQLERRSEVDSGINQERHLKLDEQLQKAVDKMKNSEKYSSEIIVDTSARLIGEPGCSDVIQKSKNTESRPTIEFSPLTMYFRDKCKGKKLYVGWSTDIGFMDVFPIKTGNEKKLKLNYGEKLLKCTLSFIDLKYKRKLSLRFEHSIKHSANRICEKYNESVAKYLSRILDDASLTYISPNLIFKYWNIVQVKEFYNNQDFKYYRVSLGRNSSNKQLIRKKRFQKKTKENDYKRKSSNTIIIDTEKRNSCSQQKSKLNKKSEDICHEDRFVKNHVFHGLHSTEPDINFDNNRSKVKKHTKCTDTLKNDENIVKGDITMKQLSGLIREVNTMRRIMEIDFERNFYNHKRISKRFSQFILKNNSNLKIINRRFKVLNGRVKELSVKQADIQEFMKSCIRESRVKNKIQELNSKNSSKKFRRINSNKISLGRGLPNEKLKRIINEQNDKYTHFQSEVNKLNKIIGKVEEHLAVYMDAIKILKECVKFHSNKIENIDNVSNSNAYKQNIILNKLNGMDVYINGIDSAVQTSIASLEEDIYANRYLIETGATSIVQKIITQNEINEKLKEQMREQDSVIAMILTGILTLKRQMDRKETIVDEHILSQLMARKLEEENPQTQDLLKFIFILLTICLISNVIKFYYH